MRRKKKNNLIFLLLLMIIVIILITFMIRYKWFFLGAAVLAIMIKFYLYVRNEKHTKAFMNSDVDNMNGIQFEHYIQKILEYQGYDAAVTKASGDLGADIIASIGSSKYSIQTKRYSHAVDRTAVSDAVAAKDHYKCDQAMVVTTNYFTPGAKELAKSTRCILVDRDQLLNWIEDYQKSKETSSISTYINWYTGAYAVLSIVLILCLVNGVSSLHSPNAQNSFDKTQTPINTQSTEIGEYNIYTNARFGYSIPIPKDFIPEPEPTNGDGRTFHSQDGKCRLSVWGSHCPQTMEFTPEQYYEWVLSHTEGEITYKTLGSNWFIVSGYQGNDIFYQKTFSGDDENTFIITYPEEQKELYSDIITDMERLFEPSTEVLYQ